MSDNSHHHRAAISSAAITGGSQAVVAALAFVRSKFAAVWIGPEGVGILGLLGQLQNVFATGFDLGVSNSAVRELSVLRSSGDIAALERFSRALFRLIFWTATTCMLLGVVFCIPLSRWMFNAHGHEVDVALTACASAFALFAGAHGTLLRGHGMVRPLALQRILVSLCLTMFAYVGYRWFGKGAVAAVALAAAFAAWIIARWQSKALLPRTRGASREEVVALVKHGLPFVWSAFSFAVASYVVGVLVVDFSGLEASGNYQAAWGLTAHLVGFVLAAMGQDFLPRLSAAIHQPAQAVAMINSQIEVGVLLSLPGMFLFSAFARTALPWVLSHQFMSAVPIAQWVLLGCLGRILNWPMLFALNAQRKSRLHVLAVTVASASYLLLAWAGLVLFGPIGAAIGFIAMQFLHTLWLRVTLSHTLGFRFSRASALAALLALVALSAAPFVHPWAAATAFLLLVVLSACRLAFLTGRPVWLHGLIAGRLFRA